MPIKYKKFLNIKILVSFITGLMLVVVAAHFFSSSAFYSSETKQNIKVVWPKDNVNLFENQVFILDILNPKYSNEELEVTWNLEDGLATGELNYVGKSQYQSNVNVSGWDWKKDNKYKLSFLVKTLDGLELNKTSVFIYAGGEKIVVQPSVEDVTHDIMPKNNTASVSDAVILVPKKEVVTKQEETTSKNDFRIEWVKSDIDGNQKFVYHTSGYDDDEIVAFWNTEGGHKNLLFKNDAKSKFTAHINVFGWRWLGKGPYKVNFSIANKATSLELASQSFDITWTGEPGSSELAVIKTGEVLANPSAITLPIQKPVERNPTEAAEVTKPVINTKNSYLLSNRLYKPAKPAVENALKATTDSRTIEALTYILSQPNSIWLNGDGYDSDEYIQSVLVQAKSLNQVPAFVLYNIPNRDCGSHSSGGTNSINAYKLWIDRIAKNLNQAEAMVIVEPDALAMLNCLKTEDRAGRTEMLKYAVEKITAAGDNVMVYLDAGHPYWVDINEMASRLRSAGVEKARGFSLNVSNYATTEDNITYGNLISNLLGGKKYVVDSSRNGNSISPTKEWCNPSGRALGESPSVVKNRGNLDAILWIKFPGESDGTCNGGPGAGQWWTNYAVDLYFNR